VRRRVRSTLAVVTATLALVVSGCAGWGGGAGGGGPNSINVLMVNNPQMVDLQQLTAKHFTKSVRRMIVSGDGGCWVEWASGRGCGLG
jgi:sorbitol/mannitol transport system substrate-binding protein